MTKLIKNELPIYENGFIFIETPHQLPKEIWYAFDENDVISRCQNMSFWDSWADKELDPLAGCTNGPPITIENAIEFIGHDLRILEVIRYQDVDYEVIFDQRPQMIKSLLALDWAHDDDIEGKE